MVFSIRAFDKKKTIFFEIRNNLVIYYIFHFASRNYFFIAIAVVNNFINFFMLKFHGVSKRLMLIFSFVINEDFFITNIYSGFVIAG